MNITQADQAAIRSTVEAQLSAFQVDDWEQAFAYAAPAIQQQVGTVASFKRMVKVSYHPVYRPRSVVFESLTRVHTSPAQQVMLMSANGNLFRAIYVMEQQPNQDWRIAGCYLIPIRDPQE